MKLSHQYNSKGVWSALVIANDASVQFESIGEIVVRGIHVLNIVTHYNSKPPFEVVHVHALRRTFLGVCPSVNDDDYSVRPLVKAYKAIYESLNATPLEIEEAYVTQGNKFTPGAYTYTVDAAGTGTIQEFQIHPENQPITKSI